MIQLKGIELFGFNQTYGIGNKNLQLTPLQEIHLGKLLEASNDEGNERTSRRLALQRVMFERTFLIHFKSGRLVGRIMVGGGGPAIDN